MRRKFSSDGGESMPPKSSARKPKMAFNHLMIYVADVPRSLEFYCDLFDFQAVEQMEGYARIRIPNTDATIALHQLSADKPRMDTKAEGLRLYFEVEDLDAFCATLSKKGVAFTQPPKDMPWGWRHAYLHDPDGHELSLYRSGPDRLTGPR